MYLFVRKDNTLGHAHDVGVQKRFKICNAILCELLSTINWQQQQAENSNGKCSSCTFTQYQNKA